SASDVSAYRLRGTISPFSSTATRLPASASVSSSAATLCGASPSARASPLMRRFIVESVPASGAVALHRLAQERELRLEARAAVAGGEVHFQHEAPQGRELLVLHPRQKARGFPAREHVAKT